MSSPTLHSSGLPGASAQFIRLMTPNPLLDIAAAIWNVAAELPFVPSQLKPRPFELPWVRKRFPDLVWFCDATRNLSKQPGWYWIATDVSFDDLRRSVADQHSSGQLHKPIGATAVANLGSIGKYICAEVRSGKCIVYNGHEIWVRGRIGGHNFSANRTSGALRISQHVSLQDGKEWSAFVFTQNMVCRLHPSLKSEVEALVSSPIGRRLVEAAWRSIYGWPLLCRQ